MLGFKSVWTARCTIAGIEVMRAIRKRQVVTPEKVIQPPAEPFYAWPYNSLKVNTLSVFIYTLHHNPYP
jgi:hypothetical protein